MTEPKDSSSPARPGSPTADVNGTRDQQLRAKRAVGEQAGPLRMKGGRHNVRRRQVGDRTV